MQAVVGSVDGKSNGIVVEYSHESLAFHVRGAVSGALYTHKWVLECLLHKDMALVDQVLQGFAAAEVSALAAWLGSDAGGCDFMSAAVLYERMVDMTRGSTKQETSENIRRCIAAADRVTEGPNRAEAIQLAFSKRTHIMQKGDSEQEKDECLEWLLAFMSDESKVAELSEYSQIRGKQFVGLVYMGHLNTKFAVSPSHEQLQRGAANCIEQCVLRIKMVENNNLTGFDYIYQGTAFDAHGLYSLTHVAADKLSEAAPFILGMGGCKLQAWSDACSFVYHHRECLLSHVQLPCVYVCVSLDQVWLRDWGWIYLFPTAKIPVSC